MLYIFPQEQLLVSGISFAPQCKATRARIVGKQHSTRCIYIVAPFTTSNYADLVYTVSQLHYFPLIHQFACVDPVYSSCNRHYWCSYCITCGVVHGKGKHSTTTGVNMTTRMTHTVTHLAVLILRLILFSARYSAPDARFSPPSSCFASSCFV